jgi:hypothetical protein
MIINLTPHALTIEGVGTVPASGTVARVGTTRVSMGTRMGVRVTLQSLGQVECLPEAKPDTLYVVSGMVLDALKRRGSPRVGADVYAPDTGADAIREGGQITAVRGLVC